MTLVPRPFRAGALAAVLAFAIAIPAPAAEPVTVRGRVAQIDLAGGSVTVEPVAGRDVTLSVVPDSRLEIRGKPAELATFDKGQWVRAAFTAEGAANELVRLRSAVATDTELAQEVRQALAGTTGYTFRQKDEYEERLRELAEGVDDRIAGILDEAKDAGRAEKAKIRARLVALRYRRAELIEQLSDVESATASTWEEVKSGVRAAAAELQRILGKPPKN